MKPIRIAIIVLFALVGLACEASSQLEAVLSFRVAPSSGCDNPTAGGMTGTITMPDNSVRGFRVDAPPWWDGTTPIPVVYTFHACGGDHMNGSWNGLYYYSAQSQWLAPDVETYDLLVVAGDSAGTCWDVSPSAADLPYYDLLRAEVESTYCVDGERRYHGGVSSGAFVAQAFACRRDGVAAVWAGLGGMHHPDPAPYGLTPTPLPEPGDCNGPVPVMAMASTTDTLVPPDVYTRPARDAWLEINGCDPGSGVPYVHRAPAADAVAGAGNGNACTGQVDCSCTEYSCTGARTVWCEYAGTGANGHSWPVYYRNAAANWFGRFVAEPGGSESSGSGSATSSASTSSSSSSGEASTSDASSTTCEMVCQCI